MAIHRPSKAQRDMLVDAAYAQYATDDNTDGKRYAVPGSKAQRQLFQDRLGIRLKGMGTKAYKQAMLDMSASETSGLSAPVGAVAFTGHVAGVAGTT